MSKTLYWNAYEEAAVKTVAEGVVLLRNENGALPLDREKNTAVFGRIQLHYYKSGTGSGGMVNVSKVTGITDGLIEAGALVDKKLLDIYRAWDKDNPFDMGEGWGAEPWSQKEMPLGDAEVRSVSERAENALVIIGRTAGEEHDNKPEKGAYFLSDGETDMLRHVRKYFRKVTVVLNTAGIIDLSFLDDSELCPDALMLVWQGGMIGGTGTARVLLGDVSPSGKLPDTVAYSYKDHASDKNFGDTKKVFYQEDIYVGYRYFETFAADKVRFPFGFGLSYTDFETECACFSCRKDKEKIDPHTDTVHLEIKVTNSGEKYSGKQVVQIYSASGAGKLGHPVRELRAFGKTKTLTPGESQILTFDIPYEELASYDDSGATGHKGCYVLEQGMYSILYGTDVRNTKQALSFGLFSDCVFSEHRQILAPFEPFDRIKAVQDNDGKIQAAYESVPLSGNDIDVIIAENIPAEIPQTGDKGIKLRDVRDGRNTMEEFIAQLSDEDLACIIRGEGMGSPRVTPGTTSAFAGVTDRLVSFGIPSVCTSDGPSGMRLDCGTKAFSLPNGTLIASTFNTELIEELFSLAGLEIAANNVDCLLGPGMNIHRHPLNGRNFEYFSEDPYLCGKMAAAELKGMRSAGVTGTVKHFCANNQELGRHTLDSVVSERALREIYLKGFELAVKEGGAKTIMTTYGSLNGVWTAGNYELNTMLLRDDWGYDGVTMTDWWANINRRGKEPDKSDFAAMAAAQNDMYMVCSDSSDHKDNTLDELASGGLARAQLQRNAMNICRFAMGTRAMQRLCGEEEKIEIVNRPQEDNDENSVNAGVFKLGEELAVPLDKNAAKQGSSFVFILDIDEKYYGEYEVTITASSDSSELAQIPVTMFVLGIPWGTFTFTGTDGRTVSISKSTRFYTRYNTVRLFFAQNGLDPESITFRKTEDSHSSYLTP